MRNYLKEHEHTNRLMKELAMEIPDALSGYMNIQRTNALSSALSTKVKELISLAIAITTNSRGCITIHVKNALDAGASREEILDTIGVTIMLGGTPAVVSGCKAFEALKLFTTQHKPALLYD